MDSYLEIAEMVLRAARRPLTPSAILDAAYKAGIVPSHLFGKTQHKTLQARLSEDILRFKFESRFYRTNPGAFFLSEFRADPNVPDELKDPFHARRRTRDLAKPCALAINREFIEKEDIFYTDWRELLKEANRSGAIVYVDAKHAPVDCYLIWSFSVLRRNTQLLSYRIGRYRDDRDSFVNRRSIGFADVVSHNDANLFNDDLGVVDRGLAVLLDDLDLSRSVFGSDGHIHEPKALFSLVAVDESSQPTLLLVMEWACPEWFEPTARRLSLNEVSWIDATRTPNNLSDFEPWSAAAISAIVDTGLKFSDEKEKNQRPTGGVYKVRA